MRRLFSLVTRTRLRTVGLLLPALGILAGTASALEVASLHPLMADLARKVGGDHVTVVELVGPNDNPHDFEPGPDVLRQARGAALILASGKGLESAYLGDLRDSLAPGQEIFEVGRLIPSLVIGDQPVAHVCQHHHHASTLDPHWWHDVRNMRRAARLVAREFARLDPDNADSYETNADRYRDSLRDLHRWVEDETARLHPDARILCTAHLAFGYFCATYGFEAVGLKGINFEDSPGPRRFAEVQEYLRQEGVRTVFPEAGVNPKMLQQVADDLGITLGQPLYADGTALPAGWGYPEMIRHNVNSLVSGLMR